MGGGACFARNLLSGNGKIASGKLFSLSIAPRLSSSPKNIEAALWSGENPWR
jgi:hypothetical protein